jgi:hypothetical protein
MGPWGGMNPTRRTRSTSLTCRGEKEESEAGVDAFGV